LLKVGEGAFDDVASVVVGRVERRRATACGFSPLAVADLVRGLGDDRPIPWSAGSRRRFV
jgi:hypothetical protein